MNIQGCGPAVGNLLMNIQGCGPAVANLLMNIQGCGPAVGNLLMNNLDIIIISVICIITIEVNILKTRLSKNLESLCMKQVKCYNINFM